MICIEYYDGKSSGPGKFPSQYVSKLFEEKLFEWKKNRF